MNQKPKLNTTKWNQDRLEAEEQIRVLKNKIRREDKPVMSWASGQQVDTGNKYRGATWKESSDLKLLKDKLTELYRVRAFLRGRRHQQREIFIDLNGRHIIPVTAEQEAKWAAMTLETYALAQAA